MKQFSLNITTPTSILFSGQVDMVVAPGTEGELGILADHTPLLTALKPGKLRVKQGDRQEEFQIHGGFLEVREDGVTILAETQIKNEKQKAKG